MGVACVHSCVRAWSSDVMWHFVCVVCGCVSPSGWGEVQDAGATVACSLLWWLAATLVQNHRRAVSRYVAQLAEHWIMIMVK